MLTLGVFAAMPMGAHAVEIQDGTGTITPNIGGGTATPTGTTIGFAGQEWWVIGNGTVGGSSVTGNVTLLVKGGNPYGRSMYNFSNTSVYDGGELYTAMTNIYNAFAPYTATGITNPKERALITSRTIDGVWDGTGGFRNTDSLTGQHVWPLSLAEWNTIDNNTVRSYGYSWWLRSPYKTDEACFSYSGGTNNGNGGVNYTDSDAVRPALNLNLSSVLFTSAASGTGMKPTGIGGSLDAVTAAPTGPIKLTVLDTGLSLSGIDQSLRIAKAGGTVDIAYTGAQTGTGRSVSVLLCNSSGTPLFYGRPATAAAGTASFTVPSSLVAGNYIIKIFNEEVNDANFTDFASTPISIPLTVDNTAPTVSSVNPTGTGVALTTGTLSVTFSEAMNTMVTGSAPVGTVNLSPSGTTLTFSSWTSNTTASYTLSGLSGNTTYTYNISGFQDAAGNVMVADTAKTFTTVAAATTANATNNTIVLNSAAVYVNEPFTFTATGDRQSVAAGTVVGDERYIPTDWDVNPSGTFPAGGPYSATTTLTNTGAHIITVVFQLQRWSGTTWTNVSTVTSTLPITSLARASAGGTISTGSPRTSDDTPLGLIISLIAIASTGLATLVIKRRFVRD